MESLKNKFGKGIAISLVLITIVLLSFVNSNKATGMAVGDSIPATYGGWIIAAILAMVILPMLNLRKMDKDAMSNILKVTITASLIALIVIIIILVVREPAETAERALTIEKEAPAIKEDRKIDVVELDFDEGFNSTIPDI